MAVAPAGISVSKVPLCLRCATKLRNGRTICPSCGLDLSTVSPSASGKRKAPTVSQAQLPATQINSAGGGTGIVPVGTKPKIAKVAAKAGMKLCMMCMQSVPEADLQDLNGQKVCAKCVEQVGNRGAGGSSKPLSEKPQSAPPQTAARDTAPPKKSDGTGLKNTRYREEQLKKQLFWPKVVMVLNALILLGLGALGFVAVKVAEAGLNAIEKLPIEETVEDPFGQHPPRKLTPTEIAAEREHRETAIKKGRDEIFKLKLGSSIVMLLGAALGIMFFFTNAYPFEICLAALILYLLATAYDLIEGNLSGLFALGIRISMIMAFIKAVHAGNEIKRMRNERDEEAADAA